MRKMTYRRQGFGSWAWLSFLATYLAWSAAAADPAGSARDKVFAWHPFLAPFHAVVLHLPIGFLMMGFILELYRMRRPSDELKRVVRIVIWFSLLSGVVTAAFGILRANGGGYETHAVDLHRWFGLGVPVATLLTLSLQRRAFRKDTGGATFLYRLGLLGTLGLLVVAGHYGGNLTHGSGYLVENAPAFVRDLVEHPSRRNAASALAGPSASARERLFADKIEPIFKAKCLSCHGPEKHKGGFRLDQPELAVKGGESGQPAIKPGDVLGSNLARLILLPPDHDDVMPPSGKEPLTLEELMQIVHWIRAGASFGPDKAVAKGQ